MKVNCPKCESINLELIDALDYGDEWNKNRYICNECKCDFKAEEYYERKLVEVTYYNIKS